MAGPWPCLQAPPDEHCQLCASQFLPVALTSSINVVFSLPFLVTSVLQCMLTANQPTDCLHGKAILWGHDVQAPKTASHSIALGNTVFCRVAGSLAIIWLVLWVPLGTGGLLARPAELPTDEERHSAVR